jgi:AIPR protein
MSPSTFYDELRAEIGNLQHEYYANAGDAFCYWAVRNYLELDEDDALAACNVGGPNDRGLDAFWIDDNQRRIVIAQAKYSERKKTFGPDVVVDLERAYNWLVRIGREGSKSAKKELKAAALELTEAQSNDPEVAIELHCFVSGTFSEEALEQANAFNRENASGSVEIKLVGAKDFEEVLQEQKSRLDERPVEVELKLQNYFEFSPKREEEPKTIVASLDVKELADIERRYHYRIFQQNVRYFLKAGNRVNKGIVTTLSTSEGRDRFWYYNNGIAIVCDSIHVTRDKRGTGGTAVVKNLQIVNGCQTTTTLGEMADELSKADNAAYVLARFVEAPDSELQAEISRFNNRQSAVKDRDLLSNDNSQERLEREFAELDPPWFYERKRGQWDAEAKEDPRKRKTFRDRRIDNEMAAQAAYAFWRDPAVARARKRMLFVKKAEDPTGLYEQIFKPSTSPEWLLLPYRVQQYVAAKKRSYMRELKTASEPKEPSVQQKRIIERQWLKFSDQIVLAAVHFYWSRYCDLDQLSTQRELLQEKSFETAVAEAYKLALRDLSRLFRSKISEGERRKEPFDPANYVKGNWGEVRSWLEDEFEVHEDEEPFVGIPAFAD